MSAEFCGMRKTLLHQCTANCAKREIIEMRLVTPFYSKHVEYGGKFMLLEDWLLPAVYTSAEEEYRMVRERAGFTDYSLQGAIAVLGRDAFGLLQKVLVNDLRKIYPGKAIYSSMLDETGKVLDDTVVFWVEEDFFIVNDAFVTDQTLKWLKHNAQEMNVSVIERGTCVLAFQGPKSKDILQKVVTVQDIPYFGLRQDKIRDIPTLIARVGFSGELGYEIYVYPKYAHELWDTVVQLGKEYGVRPYGLEAGHILQVEKGYIYGSDFYKGSTPLEVGLEWTVAFDKGDFVGKEALLQRKSKGLRTKLMGFEVCDPKIVASEGDNLVMEGRVVGKVTSDGAYGPSIGKSLGWGWVEVQYANEGDELELEHENNKTKIKMAPKRWYDPEGKRIRA